MRAFKSHYLYYTGAGEQAENTLEAFENATRE